MLSGSPYSESPSPENFYLVSGTPQFASPEHLAGDGLDVRSDIFSLGATLWYALTGHSPYDADSWREVMERQRRQPLDQGPLTASGVPPVAIALLGSMLAHDRNLRPGSAALLHERIESVLRTIGDAPTASWRWLRVSGLSLGIAAVAMAGVATLERRPASPEPLASTAPVAVDAEALRLYQGARALLNVARFERDADTSDRILAASPLPMFQGLVEPLHRVLIVPRVEVDPHHLHGEHRTVDPILLRWHHDQGAIAFLGSPSHLRISRGRPSDPP